MLQDPEFVSAWMAGAAGTNESVGELVVGSAGDMMGKLRLRYRARWYTESDKWAESHTSLRFARWFAVRRQVMAQEVCAENGRAGKREDCL